MRSAIPALAMLLSVACDGDIEFGTGSGGGGVLAGGLPSGTANPAGAMAGGNCTVVMATRRGFGTGPTDASACLAAMADANVKCSSSVLDSTAGCDSFGQCKSTCTLTNGSSVCTANIQGMVTGQVCAPNQAETGQ